MGTGCLFEMRETEGNSGCVMSTKPEGQDYLI